MDQRGSKRIKEDQRGSKRIKEDQRGSKGIKGKSEMEHDLTSPGFKGHCCCRAQVAGAALHCGLRPCGVASMFYDVFVLNFISKGPEVEVWSISRGTKSDGSGDTCDTATEVHRAAGFSFSRGMAGVSSAAHCARDRGEVFRCAILRVVHLRP